MWQMFHILTHRKHIKHIKMIYVKKKSVIDKLNCIRSDHVSITTLLLTVRYTTPYDAWLQQLLPRVNR